MATRESWEEVSFQVFTDEDGVLRSGYYPTGEGTVTGNVQVDRVWGNVPMQPDDDRTDMGYSFGGGEGDQGWDSTYSYTSDTLRISNYNNNNAVQGLFSIVPNIATDHVRASTGYSNFPAYIENYAGDGDAGLEGLVPNVVRLNKTVGRNLINAAGLDYSNNYENPDITGVTSDGTTIRIYVDDLFGLKAGDKVYPDNNEYSYGGDEVTITAVGAAGPSDWFEFEAATAPDPALDTEAMGTVWPGSNVLNVILSQNREPGDIINDNLSVEITMLGD
jgi:hypothetical protein